MKVIKKLTMKTAHDVVVNMCEDILYKTKFNDMDTKRYDERNTSAATAASDNIRTTRNIGWK